MFDSNAEIEENRQLDKLLNVLVSQSDEEFESEEESDNEFQAEYEDDIENTANDVLDTPLQPAKPLRIEKITTEQLTSQISLSNLYQNISFEEFDLITGCKDKDLKELMTLNRAKHVHLKTIISKYEEMLIECEGSLRSHLINLRTRDTTTSIGQVSRINRYGYPYFNYLKSRPSNNSDFYKKKAMNVVNLTYESRMNRWVQFDLVKLKTCVLFNYYSNYLTREDVYDLELGDLPASLSRNLWRKKFDDIVKRVKQLGKVVCASEFPALRDDTYLNWDYIAENHFKDAGRASSLKAMWNNYVHPSINRADFTDEEIRRIVVYVHEHPDTNWSELVSYLNTNRSEHQLCMQYQMSLYLDSKEVDTSVSECINDLTTSEENIKQLISSWKNFPVAGITKEFQRILKREQYLNGLKYCRKGNFSVAEDVKILALVQKYGMDFKTIGLHMPTRSWSQIQNRYWNTLCQQEKRFANWSLAEDEDILEHVRIHGEQKWALLMHKLPRNAAQLRHRYVRLKKKMKEPDFDLATMPRRVGFTGYAKRHKQINIRAQMTDEEVERVIAAPSRKVRMRTDIDDQLVSFFSPAAQLKKYVPAAYLNETQLKDCTSAVKAILDIFNTTLYIPTNINEENCPELDFTDIEVLKRLRTHSDTSDLEDEVIEVMPESSRYTVIPPNEGSMQTLRYLLLQSFGSESSVGFKFPESGHIQHFKDIFKAFLHLPSLLSTVEPDDTICPIIAEKEGDHFVIPLKRRKSGRPVKGKNKKKVAVERKITRKSRKEKAKRATIEKAKQSTEKQTNKTENEQVKIPTVNENQSVINETSSKEVNSKVSLPQPSKTPTVAKDTKVLIQLDKATIAKLKKQNILKAVKLVELKNPCVIITREQAQFSLPKHTSTSEPDITNEDNASIPEAVDDENTCVSVNETKQTAIASVVPVNFETTLEEHDVNTSDYSETKPQIKSETTIKTRSKSAVEVSVHTAPKVVRSYGGKRKLSDGDKSQLAKKNKSDVT